MQLIKSHNFIPNANQLRSFIIAVTTTITTTL